MASFDAHWPGFTHRELYDLIHNRSEEPAGMGASAGAAAAQAWTDLAELMSGVAARLADRSELADWARSAQRAATAAAKAVLEHLDAFLFAQYDMPVPGAAVRLRPSAGTVEPVAMQVDQDPVEARAQAAKQRAVEVLTTYARRSAAAMTGMAGAGWAALAGEAVEDSRGPRVDCFEDWWDEFWATGVSVTPGRRANTDT